MFVFFNLFDFFVIIAFIASLTLCFSVLMLHQMHMFQLNSYKPKVHKAWLLESENKSQIIKNYIQFLIIYILISIFGRNGIIAGAVWYIIMALLNRPAKAKKPLVYTKRVKRMLVTVYIIYFMLNILALAFSNFNYAFGIFTLISVLIYPVIILMANFINQPIEKKINNGFINEAKDIIDSMPNLTVIGVTGSYGKTSVKFYLQKLLSAKYNVLVTPENYNTTLGVVRTIRENLRATHEIFVCEMGAKNIGDIKEICDLVHPTHGIITSIGPQHLESFLTIDNVIKTKFELADSVSKKGFMFLNYDNEYIANHKTDNNIITYGIKNKNANYMPYDISVSSKGSSFKLMDENQKEYSFSTKLIGEHNVVNIAGAIAVAHTLGIPMEQLVIQVKRLEGVPHRLQLHKGNNALIIDDAYNSNPSGAKAALDTLAQFDGFKVVVTPGMVELGTAQYECNKVFGTQIAEVADVAVLVGQKQAEPILSGLNEVNYPQEKIFVAENLTQALNYVDKINTNGLTKVVLLENDLPDNY